MRRPESRPHGLWLIIALAVALALGGAGLAAAQTTKTLRIGADVPKDVPASDGIACMATEVAKRTAGRIKIEYYPNSQLGTPEEQIAGTRAGSQEGWFGAAGQTARLLSTYQLTSPAFAHPDRGAALALLRSPFFDGVRAELQQKHGLVTVFYDWYRGDRELLAKRPIRSVQDLQGLKLRVPASPAKVAAWKKLGASPTPIPPAELYMALKEGVVDGLEIELETMHADHHDEVAKYLTLTHHESSFASLIVNQKFWDGLTADDRKILKDVAGECGRGVTASIEERDRKTLEAMKKEMKVEVITLTPAQREPFLKIGQQGFEELEAQKKWWPAGTVAKIRARDPQYYRP
jgi:TRAP-type transport system periplasmic protein